ncbi:MAG: ion transporter, partial [Burkholderiales bacterium]
MTRSESAFVPSLSGWRLRLYTIVFEADTRAGRWFDIGLIVAILFSVLVVVADSVQSLQVRHGELFYRLEWGFTLLFTAEYLLRLACAPHPWRYVRSFFGVVDLLSVLPTYIALLFPETQALIDVRVLRLIRIFRVFKLTAYMGAVLTKVLVWHSVFVISVHLSYLRLALMLQSFSLQNGQDFHL